MSETRTRIGTMRLTGRSGSIELPEGVAVYCPICGTPGADKGDCIIEFNKVPSRISEVGPDALVVVVDCRNCNAQNLPPTMKR